MRHPTSALTVERYDPAKHLGLIGRWVGQPMSADALPKTGFIVGGVACAFLYLTDSRVAFMECLATDITASVRARGAAIHRLFDELCGEARRLGYSRVIGAPSRRSLAVMLKQHGFLYASGFYAWRNL